VERPGSVIVEVNGSHQALHLFGNPPEKDVPAPDAPGVRYFGPGVHRVGKIILQSNETVYIAGGAVVYGSVIANGASHIRIAGRGILDVSPYPRGEGGGAVRLAECSDVTVEGIVMRDPDVWCCSLFGCRNVTIANVKLVGLWRYNADGIDVCNSQEVEVRDCFVRAFDDALVIKGLRSGREPSHELPVKNVRFRRCVVWCDWGRAMEVGAETCAPEIAGVVFQDCDIMRTTHVAMDIQHGDRAAIHDIRFENVRFETSGRDPQPRMQTSRDEKYSTAPDNGYLPKLMEVVIYKTDYSKDAERGTVRDVVFSDIAVIGPQLPPSSFRGFDAEHGVEGVTIANLRLNGRPVSSAAEARLQIGPHVSSVEFTGASAPSNRR
jgi:polygalacturonase